LPVFYKHTCINPLRSQVIYFLLLFFTWTITVWTVVFWVVMLCSLVSGYRCFRGTIHLHDYYYYEHEVDRFLQDVSSHLQSYKIFTHTRLHSIITLKVTIQLAAVYFIYLCISTYLALGKCSNKETVLLWWLLSSISRTYAKHHCKHECSV
jgi:hypothetical protein